jgi:hypothetical protein
MQTRNKMATDKTPVVGVSGNKREYSGLYCVIDESYCVNGRINIVDEFVDGEYDDSVTDPCMSFHFDIESARTRIETLSKHFNNKLVVARVKHLVGKDAIIKVGGMYITHIYTNPVRFTLSPTPIVSFGCDSIQTYLSSYRDATEEIYKYLISANAEFVDNTLSKKSFAYDEETDFVDLEDLNA